MISNEFRAVAVILGRHISDTYDLLNLTDEILVALGIDGQTIDYSTHEGRVKAGLASTAVMNFVREGKKIQAIKELRLLTRCGLKEAKDAVEDASIWDVSPEAIARREREAREQAERQHERAIAELRAKLTGNPWDDDYDPDEPPF